MYQFVPPALAEPIKVRPAVLIFKFILFQVGQSVDMKYIEKRVIIEDMDSDRRTLPISIAPC
jgi:hypothetical protein